MNTFSSGALCRIVLPLVCLASCAEHQATALVIDFTEEPGLKDIVTQVQISAARGGTSHFSQHYAVPHEARFPATLTFSKIEDAPDSQAVLYEIVAMDTAGHARITRQARLGFVEEHTKLLRLPLEQSCLDHAPCNPDETCAMGECVKDVIDAGGLPDFTSNGDVVASGSGGSAGTAGEGGTAGSAGAEAGANGASGTAGAAGTGGMGGMGGSGGSAPTPLSCLGLAQDCGATGHNDCCSTATTILGDEVYYRDYDAADDTYTTMSWPATMPAFRMDKYEVTVGRFRAFLGAYDAWRLAGNPANGSGGDPMATPAGTTSWSATWNMFLPMNAAAFLDTQHLFCDMNYSTFTSTNTEGMETVAINCVSWYEAAAFCQWDGGWLPTEAAWVYVAAGGAQNRAYPWSVPPSSTSIDGAHANYLSLVGHVDHVGAHEDGAGRWGQQDMAGNVYEWIWDDTSTVFSGTQGEVCDDCTSSVPDEPRAIRGGYFDGNESLVRVNDRDELPPSSREYSIGFRCARAVP